MKRVICGGRAVGKTTEAMKACAETGAYFVVSSAKEAERVFRQAQEMGLNLRYPITYNDLKDNGLRTAHPSVRRVVIDNADWFLKFVLSGVEIEAITIEAPIQKLEVPATQQERDM